MTQEYYPTRHLLQKMQAREVTWGEILEVIEHPDVKFGPDFKGQTLQQKDNLGVVTARDGAVVTVLLRQDSVWTDEEARKRNQQGDKK